MRRLKSKQNEVKKTKKNQMIIGMILIIVMFGSVFGVIVGSFNNSEESADVDYYGYKFASQGSYWYTNVGSTQFVFRFNPFETEYMYNKSITNLTYINSYQNLPLYIYSDNYESEIEIYRNIGQFAQRIQRACLIGNEENCDSELPIKDCNENFIIIRENLNNESAISQEGKCVFITGEKQNLIKLTDDYLFRIIGIR